MVLLDVLQEHEAREITPRMAEFLTLAEAVRGLKGQRSTVTHVGSPLPSASPAQAPAPAGQLADRRDYWTADQDNSLLEVSPAWFLGTLKGVSFLVGAAASLHPCLIYSCLQ